jgi:hypothetical protein
MVKVKPNGEAEEEKTLTAKNSVDINVPNTEKLSNGAERIDKIRKLISGEKPPVTISEEKKKAIQQKLEGLRKIEASKVTPTISKDTKTESGLVKPSIEDELLKDVPETVEGIEGASIGESKGEIVSENVSGEKAIDNPAEVKADNPIKPVVTEQQVKPITQEQPAKHVEQENKSSIFGRFSKWVKVVGKNPDSSGAARLVEIQKANKN